MPDAPLLKWSVEVTHPDMAFIAPAVQPATAAVLLNEGVERVQ
jgi:hypothetical protein